MNDKSSKALPETDVCMSQQDDPLFFVALRRKHNDLPAEAIACAHRKE